MKISNREILAACVAPLAAPLVFALIASAREPGWLFAHGSMPLMGLVLLLGYAAFLVIAVPVIFMLKHFRVYTLLNLALAGFAAGIVVHYVFYRYTGLMYIGQGFTYAMFLWGGLHGFVVGLFYYLISGCNRATDAGREEEA